MKKITTAIKDVPGSLKDHHNAAKGPSTKYVPNRPENGPGRTADDLASSSRVLHQWQKDRDGIASVHRPAPPPRRGMSGSSTTPSIASTSSSAHPVPTSPPPLLPARRAESQSQSGPFEELPSQSTSLGAVSLAPRSRAASSSTTTWRDIADMSAGPKPFSQFDSADKDEFFSMMDEFFEAMLAKKAASQFPSLHVQVAPVEPSSTDNVPPEAVPTSAVGRTRRNTDDGLAPSYPPPQTHSSSALSIIHYILYEPYVNSQWFTSSTPTPPPLEGRTDLRWSGSMSQYGDKKSMTGFALFGDCSVAWWNLEWSASEELKSGRLQGSMMNVEKHARYRPVPQPWDGERLYNASQAYGPLIVQFAEQAVASRRPVARGECWDVAAEALNAIEREHAAQLPKPFPSIGRTHGHLMYYAKAGPGNGKEGGKWRGEDAYVRPGDIVEWRTVRIRELGAPAGSYSTLGDPDHTAVIIEAGEPTSLPSPDEPYPISSLVSLSVVEQSRGQLPTRRTYDMSAMSVGEIWIYRPVGLVEYVGTDIEAVWPPTCESWQVDELEA